jgi:hypothetical protein
VWKTNELKRHLWGQEGIFFVRFGTIPLASSSPLRLSLRLNVRPGTHATLVAQVTFLGRLPDAMEERMMMRGGLRVKMDDYIKQRAKKWKFPWQILKDMDAQARIDYMRSGARLAILPSLMENSPYTVIGPNATSQC